MLDAVVTWSHQHWAAFSRRTLDQTRARFAAETGDGGLPFTVVASVAGAPLGFASLRAADSVDWQPGLTPWVCNVYVDESARGRGVASALCMALEAHARMLGLGALHLATTRSDSLYHRIGYLEIGAKDHRGVPHRILVKDIRPMSAPPAASGDSA